jgi:hypothetical protein
LADQDDWRLGESSVAKAYRASGAGASTILLTMSLNHSESQPTLVLTDREQAWTRVVVEKVRALRFGTVHIKVHEAQVVLVEATEQTRFDLGTKSRG